MGYEILGLFCHLILYTDYQARQENPALGGGRGSGAAKSPEWAFFLNK
jgi:hypothetical protein